MKLQGDLSGLTADLSGMTLGTSSSSPPLPSSSISLLSSLDEEMRKLPSADTVAYYQAVSECPDQVSPRRRMMFVECEENNVPLAARRLALHWRLRFDLFGPRRAFLPMTLSGAMQDEIEHIVKRPINQLLPSTDASGRAIICTVATRRNFAEYSVKQENRIIWYLLEVASENDQVRKSGFVGVTDGRNVERKHFSKKLAADREELLCRAQPIPFRSLHLLHPSLLAHYFILPIVKNLLRRNARFRMISHYGSQSEVLRELEEDYRLPRTCLPTDIGGAVQVDVMKWVQERFSLETSRADQNMYVQPTLSNAAVAFRGDDTNGATMKAPAKKKKKDKRGGNRGKADPRMDRAVEAREGHPDMTPYDALLFGGFIFTKAEGSNEMVDANNINLKQRRNQLARRIRHNAARRKEAAATTTRHAEQGKVHDPPQPSDVPKAMATTRALNQEAACTGTTNTSIAAVDAPNANGMMIDGAFSTCIPAAATHTDVINTAAAFTGTTSTLEQGVQHAHHVQQQQYQQQQQQAHVSHVHGGKRRHSADSFDDEINALPGIGDMILAEGDADDLASCDSSFGDD